MKRLQILILLFGLLVSSCTNFNELDIKSVKLQRFNLVNTSRADVSFNFLVDNPTNSSIIVTSAEGFITKKGVNFAQIGLLKADTISSRVLSSGILSFQVDLLDPISLLSMGLNISSWRVQDFNLDAKISIRTSKGYKKVIKFKDVPLDRLVNRL
jgi:hypothetical protein